MDKDRLDGLLALKMVAEKRSFIAAAKEMKVSGPAISKMIAQLERRMGVTLMTRTTRTVSLTEFGREFLSQVSPAIEQILAAQDNALSVANRPAGLLKLNIPGVLYPAYLAPIVRRFNEEYPEITVDIYADDHATNIFEHGFDAGIRASEILAKDMVAVKLFGPISFLTVASPKYLKKAGRPKLKWTPKTRPVT